MSVLEGTTVIFLLNEKKVWKHEGKLWLADFYYSELCQTRLKGLISCMWPWFIVADLESLFKLNTPPCVLALSFSCKSTAHLPWTSLTNYCNGWGSDPSHRRLDCFQKLQPRRWSHQSVWIRVKPCLSSPGPPPPFRECQSNWTQVTFHTSIPPSVLPPQGGSTAGNN